MASGICLSSGLKSIRNVEGCWMAGPHPSNYNFVLWYFSGFSLWSFAHFTRLRLVVPMETDICLVVHQCVLQPYHTVQRFRFAAPPPCCSLLAVAPSPIHRQSCQQINCDAYGGDRRKRTWEAVDQWDRAGWDYSGDWARHAWHVLLPSFRREYVS